MICLAVFREICDIQFLIGMIFAMRGMNANKIIMKGGLIGSTQVELIDIELWDLCRANVKNSSKC